ncbi:MAG: ATP-dependent 6-phosphofructokinase [Pseudomonadota bacterium]
MIGVITCGGDCPGLNAVLYALSRVCEGQLIGIVQNAINTDRSVFETVDLSNLPKYITTVGGTILGSIVASDLSKHDPKRFETLQSDFARTIKQVALSALIVIAGDGGIRIMTDLCTAIDLPMVAIPKTIDNDVQDSDFAIGFYSVVEHVTQHLTALSATSTSHKRIMVAEVMGRDAGYIALMSGIAAFGDVILIPEIQYDFEAALRFTQVRYHASNAGVLWVVSEGVKTPSGQHTYIRGKRYGGVGQELAQQIEARLNLPTRSIRLGHLQRGGESVAFDRLLANQMAVKAKQLIDQKKYNHMVVVQGSQIDAVPISFPNSRQMDNLAYWQETAKSLGIFL